MARRTYKTDPEYRTRCYDRDAGRQKRVQPKARRQVLPRSCTGTSAVMWPTSRLESDPCSYMPPLGRIGTSVPDGWRESSRARLIAGAHRVDRRWRSRPAPSGVLGHLLSSVLDAAPPAERHDDHPGQDRQKVVGRVRGIDQALEVPLLQDHLAGHVAEDAAAEPDDPHEAVHQRGQETAAPHDDRQRERDAEDDEGQVAVGCGGDGEHVVEAHDRVGHDDDPDRFPQRASVAHMALGARLLAYQLDGDPQEQEAADELEERDLQQERRDRDEQESQPDSASGAPDASPELLALRQRADRQRDDEGVVARQRQVDHDDPDDPHPEFWIHQKHHSHSTSAFRSATSARPTTIKATAMARPW